MFLFLTAKDRGIEVNVDKQFVGRAENALQLATLFFMNGVDQETDIFFSSTVDFAAEEGFDGDSDAHNMIDEALEIVVNNAISE
jgi:sulfur relay (sulfurtransferase) complex TusBCD TusD component (DsrE family)